jgi:hypothetical protein
MTQPETYVQIAGHLLKKVKGYCQNQATDEPQILALAEQLSRYHLSDYAVLDEAVCRLGGCSAAADPGFHMTLALIVGEARKLRSDAFDRQPLPQVEGGVASEEHRQKCMADIRGIISKQGAKWSIPADL